MKFFLSGGCLLLLSLFIEIVQPTCVLESDFGFKINCAFKKSGLFRVRNLGGVKAHASIGFSLGDELGFEQSLTNLDPSRRRSVSVRNGAPVNTLVDTSTRSGKQEKRGKQSRIMMRPMAPATRPNQAAMDKLSILHRRISSTMQPIIVGPTIESPKTLTPVNIPMKQAQKQSSPSVTLAKPMAMGVPPFRPLPPKEETLKVLPLASTTKKIYTPLQVPTSKGPGLAYQSEHYPQVSHDQVSKMVSQMTASHVGHPPLVRITPAPIFIDTSKLYSVSTTVYPFVPMPVAAPPTQGFSIVSAPNFKDTLPPQPTQFTFQTPSNFIDPAPTQIHNLASQYAYNIKKVDDYNSITGYNDDTVLKVNKEDINAKIVEIAKAGNISMEAVEAAIALRQQQLLTKYANLGIPSSSSTTTTTTTTEAPIFEPEPEPEIEVVPAPSKPKHRSPTVGKVMNAPREYYPVGYEKNFDDQFTSRVDLPPTAFSCGEQRYFPGLYGDEGLGCMVFHVCALTDDGLVMKSFLCPESTLFDQTILKCNWWFYVDCKNTKKLYDTNIPVSKSYQLMKALTFFSSYKKEMQDSAATNPEDVSGIKEAITILENQDSNASPSFEQPNAIRIVTPQSLVDERSNHKEDNTTSPVYRGTRNFNVTKLTARKTTFKPKTQEARTNDYKLITLNADLNFKNKSNNSNENISASNSAETSTEKRESTTEKRHRRRMTLRNNNGPSSTTVRYTTTTPPSTTTQKPETTTYTTLLQLIRKEIQPMDSTNKTDEKQVKLTDQIADLSEIDHSILKDAEKLPPNKRFYRSSAEVDNNNEEKELVYVNNEKVQVVRPTSSARLVGEYQTPTATIARLDEAVLGRSNNQRFKKSVISLAAANQPPRNLESERT